MLSIPVAITATMACALARAATSSLSTVSSSAAAASSSSSLPPTSDDGDGDDSDVGADFYFLPPRLEPYIHVQFFVNVPTNTSTELGLVGRAPNMGGNVTGAITGTIIPVGAAYELIPAGPEGIRSIYSNAWSINASMTADGSADGTATIIMKADAFVQYANEAVFGQGAVSFEGRPGTNLSFEAFVGQVSGDFGTGTGILDVFKLKPRGRVDGKPVKALLPPGQAE